MNIEINVAKKTAEKDYKGNPTYKHFFATAERSITNSDELKKVLPIMREKFPFPEYRITVNVDPGTHYYFDLEESDTNEAIVQGVLEAVYPSMKPKNKAG